MAVAKPNAQAAQLTTFEKFLLDHGFLNKYQQDKFLTIKSAKYGSADKKLELEQVVGLLTSEKILDDEDVAKARAAFLNLPYIDLSTITTPEEVFSLVPEESRMFYKMVPFELSGRDLKIALVDPSNIQAIEALEFLG